jgi:hypothetical protein
LNSLQKSTALLILPKLCALRRSLVHVFWSTKNMDWIHLAGLKGSMRIFVYSSPKNVGEVKQLYRMGADSFLRKPATEDELRGLIDNFPEPWELKDEAVVEP